jgi:hypothetical protein
MKIVENIYIKQFIAHFTSHAKDDTKFKCKKTTGVRGGQRDRDKVTKSLTRLFGKGLESPWFIPIGPWTFYVTSCTTKDPGPGCVILLDQGVIFVALIYEC